MASVADDCYTAHRIHVFPMLGIQFSRCVKGFFAPFYLEGNGKGILHTLFTKFFSVFLSIGLTTS